MVQSVQNHEINKHTTSSWLKLPMNENSAKVKLDHAPISINFYQLFLNCEERGSNGRVSDGGWSQLTPWGWKPFNNEHLVQIPNFFG